MSDCPRFESIAELRAHAASCEHCRGLLAIHDALTEAAARMPEPDEDELDLRQVRVLRQLSRRRTGRPLRFAAIAAGIVLPFVIGLLVGRSSDRPSSRLMDSLRAEAASNRELADVEDSPFTYSNVSFRRLPDDRVALDFDVTTHLATVDSIRSPLAREVVAQSLLNPSSVGERLKAMSFAAGGLDPTIEKAVIFALRRDENVAVRLAALTVLASRLDEEGVRSALMDALKDDPSVQVRLAALESLASRPVDRRQIREAIRTRPAPGNEALMVRLAELEKKL
ncbi:MAG TPA: HEAT repeat domain-containing protein [Candidatus Polarisedimenticolaceae bacterium]|nr:HEAT repeat domain-containing protein [Candidatus Polarisedimenticolaceae bacterium]